MTLKTGTDLNNNYRVVKLIGKGAMGNVYLVERIKDDKKLVVKELFFKEQVLPDTSNAKEIFFREAEFMSKFDHPGLPKMYGMFSQDGKEYITMDYIEGRTLEEIINLSEGPLKEGDAIKWTIEIACILDYLHNSFHTPVVYRDLKPSNIIIKPDNRAVLVDFGIVRYYNPDKNTDTFSYGSPGYAAPEQYKGRGQSSPQSDVFGLGVILFQMLTKYDPSIKPLTFPVMKGLNPSVSDELDFIVKRAIELDPMKRYISMKEFEEKLEIYRGIDDVRNGCRKTGKVRIKYEGNMENKLASTGLALGISTVLTPFVVYIMSGVMRGLAADSSNIEIKRFLINSFPFLSFLMPLVPLAGLILSIKGKNRALKDKNISYNPSGKAIVCNIFFLTAIVLFSFMFYRSLSGERESGSLAFCESNLKKIATALEMYAEDNKGYYPPEFSYLTKNSKYMKSSPLCSRYYTGYEYIYSNETHNFTIFCKELDVHIWAGMKEGSWPQYSPSGGLILKFVWEK
jgi:tRNA A-37 threonylcarbamoyl transferase component Bud32